MMRSIQVQIFIPCDSSRMELQGSKTSMDIIDLTLSFLYDSIVFCKSPYVLVFFLSSSTEEF